jgi:CheY-like chemotaxis protein
LELIPGKRLRLFQMEPPLEKGLEQMASTPFDVIVSDLNMPG